MIIPSRIAQNAKRNRFVNVDGGFGSPVSQQLFIVNVLSGYSVMKGNRFRFH